MERPGITTFLEQEGWDHPEETQTRTVKEEGDEDHQDKDCHVTHEEADEADRADRQVETDHHAEQPDHTILPKEERLLKKFE